MILVMPNSKNNNGFASAKSQSREIKSQSSKQGYLYSKKDMSLIKKAILAYQAKQYDDCISICNSYLKVNNNNSQMLGLLASSYKQTNDLDKAFEFFRKSLKISQDNADILHNYSGFLLDRLDYENAFKASKRAISISKNNAQHILRYVVCLQQVDRCEEAFQISQSLIKKHPDLINAWLNIVSSAKSCNKLDEAYQLASIAYKKFPKNPEIVLQFLMTSRALGYDVDNQASEALVEIAKLQPDGLQYVFALSKLAESEGDLNRAKQMLVSEFSKESLPSNKLYILIRLADFDLSNAETAKLISQFQDLLPGIQDKQKVLIDVHFQLSKLYHSIGNYKSSAESLSIANNAKFSQTQKDDSLNSVLHKVNHVNIKNYETLEIPSAQCKHIFIVGLPRCGSTLTESILSIKENVVDLGEIMALGKALNTFSNSPSTSSLRDLYSYNLLNNHNINADSCVTVDKNLANFSYCLDIVSSIKCARVIYCKRNPLDQILSNYRANFAQGLIYTFSLTHLAHALVALERKMCEIEQAYPSLIYHLDYDQLVAKPDLHIRNLVHHLGWEWDNKYLRPEDNIRTVQTASVQQVRRPINANSLGGWQKYADLLDPCIPILKNSGLFDHYDF